MDKIKQTQLSEELNKLLLEFVQENEIQIDEVIDNSTRLMGNDSLFDSMDLVSFIVEVENFINQHYEVNIELANDRAMSRRTSPFININTLCLYIMELINE